MMTRHGLTSVSAVLQRELSRRFNSLLDLTADGFNLPAEGMKGLKMFS